MVTHMPVFAFKYICFECTWWRLFQKRTVRIKFDIYVFINGYDNTLVER